MLKHLPASSKPAKEEGPVMNDQTIAEKVHSYVMRWVNIDYERENYPDMSEHWWRYQAATDHINKMSNMEFLETICEAMEAQS